MDAENNDEILRRMEQRLTGFEERDNKRRIRSIVIWVCVFTALAVLLIVFMPKISSFAESYSRTLAIIDKVETALDGVDIEKLSETLKAVSALDPDKIRSLPDTLEVVSSLDGVDIEKLAETLRAVSELEADQIRSIAATINEVSQILEPIKGLFGK